MIEKIPHYVNNPQVNAATAPELKLFRPKINFFKAFIYVFVHFIVALVGSLVWGLLLQPDESHPFVGVILKFLIILSIAFAITLRFTFIWFVRVYQCYAKSETRLRCFMTPSCSEYAILAFKKYGAIWGGVKTIKRLFRCHSPGGIDYP